jgi:hypothetical protein
MADLIVTVHPGSDIDAVADRLAKAGFQVKDKLEAVGAIIGSAQDQHIALLRNIPGVTDISESLPVQLNPPGTPR